MPVETYYEHYSRVPPGDWPLNHFKPREIASKGNGAILANWKSLQKLDALRASLGKPMVVVSAYRDPAHNKRVGGAKNSYHMRGMAFDISMANHNPQHFEAKARAVGFTGFGYYPHHNFMHIDTGPARSWGTPFPVSKATMLPPEPPVHEPTEDATGNDTVTTVGEDAPTGFLDWLAKLFGRKS